MPFALYNDGLAFFRENKFVEAKGRFDAAIKATTPRIFREPYRDRGRTSYLLSDYRSAVADLDIAIRYGINDASAFYVRGKANEAIGNADASLADLESAAKIEEASDIMLDLSYAYASRKLYQQALDTTSKAIKTYPNLSGLYNNRGVAWRGLNKLDLARTDFQHAIDLDKHNTLAWTNLGDSYADQQAFDDAIRCYMAALADNQENSYVLQRLSVAQAQAGRGKEALHNATRVNIIDPSSLIGQLLVANGHQLTGRSDMSKLELDTAIEKHPRSFEALASRCSLFAALGKYDSAAKDCSAALEIKPKDALALALRCMMKLGQGTVSYDCDDAVEADKTGSFSYSARALLRLQVGSIDGALSDAQQAVRNNANDAFSQAVLSGVLLSNKSYRMAIDASDLSIRLNPSLAFTYLIRAAAKYKINDNVGARKDVDTMRTLAHDSKTLYSAAGELEFEADENESAAEDLELAIRDGETGLDIHLLCGIANYNVGNVDRALKYINKAVLMYPRAPSAYEARGLIYKLVKDQTSAASDFATAATLRSSKTNISHN